MRDMETARQQAANETTARRYRERERMIRGQNPDGSHPPMNTADGWKMENDPA